MPLKGAKKRKYNKKYYAENKDKISQHKTETYHENLEKSGLKTAACKKTTYYDDIEKSRLETAARKKQLTMMT